MELAEKLFWDISYDTLDYEKHKLFIIERVLQRGDIQDWNSIRDYYGRDQLRTIVTELKNIDLKSVHFLSNIFQIPLDTFKCYIPKL